MKNNKYEVKWEFDYNDISNKIDKELLPPCISVEDILRIYDELKVSIEARKFSFIVCNIIIEGRTPTDVADLYIILQNGSIIPIKVSNLGNWIWQISNRTYTIIDFRYVPEIARRPGILRQLRHLDYTKIDKEGIQYELLPF